MVAAVTVRGGAGFYDATTAMNMPNFITGFYGFPT